MDLLFFNISTHLKPKSSISYDNSISFKKMLSMFFLNQIYNASTHDPLEFLFIRVTCNIIIGGE